MFLIVRGSKLPKFFEPLNALKPEKTHTLPVLYGQKLKGLAHLAINVATSLCHMLVKIVI